MSWTEEDDLIRDLLVEIEPDLKNFGTEDGIMLLAEQMMGEIEDYLKQVADNADL